MRLEKLAGSSLGWFPSICAHYYLLPFCSLFGSWSKSSPCSKQAMPVLIHSQGFIHHVWVREYMPFMADFLGGGGRVEDDTIM